MISWGYGSWLSPGRQSSRDLIDLRHLVRAQLPRDRFDVLLDLLDTGRAGDHARDLWPRREPGEGEFEQRMPALLRERFQLLHDLFVMRRDITVAQRRRLAETRIVGRRLAAPVFAGQ